MFTGSAFVSNGASNSAASPFLDPSSQPPLQPQILQPDQGQQLLQNLIPLVLQQQLQIQQLLSGAQQVPQQQTMPHQPVDDHRQENQAHLESVSTKACLAAFRRLKQSLDKLESHVSKPNSLVAMLTIRGKDGKDNTRLDRFTDFVDQLLGELSSPKELHLYCPKDHCNRTREVTSGYKLLDFCKEHSKGGQNLTIATVQVPEPPPDIDIYGDRKLNHSIPDHKTSTEKIPEPPTAVIDMDRDRKANHSIPDAEHKTATETVSVFWDYVNYPIFGNLQACEILNQIKKLLPSAKKFSFNAYVASSSLSPSNPTCLDLESAGVSCHYQDTLVQDMVDSVVDSRHATIVLISSDSLSKRALNRLKHKGISTILIHNDVSGDEPGVVDWKKEVMDDGYEPPSYLDAVEEKLEKYIPLIKTLQRFHKQDGQRNVLRSQVGKLLVDAYPSVYKDLGFENFKDYTAKAALCKVVELEGYLGKATISLTDQFLNMELNEE
ncbi:hypothetical protein BDR26DRAFT_871669 [Obelidium mucronatum]|nr:hypothetical protein BDR26DRAFT_871669 [Obelidium mucronatum]